MTAVAEMQRAPSERRNLLDLGPAEMAEAFAEMGEKPFRVDQILGWVYDKGVDDFLEMSNIARELRLALAERFEVRLPKVLREERSSDGTIKYLFEVERSEAIESVIIPEPDRITLCVSSQVGCAIGCKFCATAKMGLKRNLEVSEIVGQLLYAKRVIPDIYGEDRRLSNVVFMGMGEPLQNWDRLKSVIGLLESDRAFKISNRRITVSTSGLIPQMKRLGEESNVSLALSLNATTNPQRTEIMPINRRWDIEELRQALLDFPRPSRRKVMIEYVLLGGVNDTVADARRLAAFVKGIPCKVNLIPHNAWPDSPYRAPDEEAVKRFSQTLLRQGINARLRVPRGRDIQAACGMLQDDHARASRESRA